jgi:hypothetical protein
MIETTVRNLREISPTIVYNAPIGYNALLPFWNKTRRYAGVFSPD